MIRDSYNLFRDAENNLLATLSTEQKELWNKMHEVNAGSVWQETYLKFSYSLNSAQSGLFDAMDAEYCRLCELVAGFEKIEVCDVSLAVIEAVVSSVTPWSTLKDTVASMTNQQRRNRKAYIELLYPSFLEYNATNDVNVVNALYDSWPSYVRSFSTEYRYVCSEIETALLFATVEYNYKGLGETDSTERVTISKGVSIRETDTEFMQRALDEFSTAVETHSPNYVINLFLYYSGSGEELFRTSKGQRAPMPVANKLNYTRLYELTVNGTVYRYASDMYLWSLTDIWFPGMNVCAIEESTGYFVLESETGTRIGTVTVNDLYSY